jgi:RNase P subunit RPR2
MVANKSTPNGQPDIPAAVLVELVRAWRRDETIPVVCPACLAPGLDITDRSARPYREWYALTCTPCGYTKTIGVSLAAPIPGA